MFNRFLCIKSTGNKVKNAQKKELAKQLYLNGNLTQKVISEKVLVTEKTIGKWVQEWKELKAAKTATKDQIIARYLRMIDQILETAEDEGRTITDSEADKISKLNKAKDSIDKEIGLSMYIQVFQEYNAYLVPLNLDLAQENNNYQDKFIHLKAIGNK